MIQTTAEYKQSVKSDIDSSSLFCEFGFLPEGSKENATYTLPSTLEISQNNSLNDEIRPMESKWATFEKNRIKLNGTYQWIKENEQRQVGVFLEPISDASGNFQTESAIEYILDKPYDIIGLMIFFDDKGEEWAEQLKITYFDKDNLILKNQIVQNSETYEGIFSLIGLQVKKIQIVPKKWNQPFKHAKITEIYPGIFFRFTEQNVFDFEFKEAINPFEPIDLPYYKFNFNNENRQFDIINPEGIAKLLRQRMKSQSQIAISNQKIPIGQFYLSKWNDKADEFNAYFEFIPSIGIKAETYPNDIGVGTQTVEEAARIILKNENYTIEKSLKNIAVMKYIGDNVTLIEAMGYLAIATSGYWIFNRDGSYHLKKWIKPTETAESIDYDIAFKVPDITQANEITKVGVKHYSYNLSKEKVEDEDGNITIQTNVYYNSFDNFVGDDTGISKTISSPFIPSVELATEVATNALAYFKNQRLNHSTQFKGDPSIQAGDFVAIQNNYEKTPVFIFDNKIVFSDDILQNEVKGVS